MADITDQHDQAAANELDDAHAVGNGNTTASENRGVKRQRNSIAEDDDDDDEKGGRERRKIEIKFITDKSRRHITFSKRKAGIMKKVREFQSIIPLPSIPLSPIQHHHHHHQAASSYLICASSCTVASSRTSRLERQHHLFPALPA
jgi:hypothetical protein